MAKLKIHSLFCNDDKSKICPFCGINTVIDDIIDPPLERILGDTKDKCNNLDENVKRVLEEVDFEFLP